jgi:hypothetical protein
MSQNQFDFLRTTPPDYDFHTHRVMIWIINGQVVTGQLGTIKSHLEMAESMGWLNGSNNEQFFNDHPRGFYLPSGNRVHFYWGVGFYFNDDLKKQILNLLPQIANNLHLKDSVKVFFGPKDTPIKGIDYPIEYAGTIREVITTK